jgi:hypothetical protein
MDLLICNLEPEAAAAMQALRLIYLLQAEYSTVVVSGLALAPDRNGDLDVMQSLDTGDECSPDTIYPVPRLWLLIYFALRRISSTTSAIGGVASITMPSFGMSSFV